MARNKKSGVSTAFFLLAFILTGVLIFILLNPASDSTFLTEKTKINCDVKVLNIPFFDPSVSSVNCVRTNQKCGTPFAAFSLLDSNDDNDVTVSLERDGKSLNEVDIIASELRKTDTSLSACAPVDEVGGYTIVLRPQKTFGTASQSYDIESVEGI